MLKNYLNKTCTVISALTVYAVSSMTLSAFPHVEDFDDTALQDTSLTTANWNTEEEQLIMQWKQQQPDQTYLSATGTAIGNETDVTLDIAIGDVDKDGDLDVVAAGFGSTNKLYLNNGSSGFPATGTAIGSETDDTYDVELADVDKDGDLDLLVGNGLQTNKLYFNNGSGGFSATGTAIGTETDNTRSIAIGDIDNDGDLDLVAGNSGQINKYYLNNGSGVFPASGVDIGTVAYMTLSVALGDLRGFGSLNLVVGNYNQVNKHYPNHANSTSLNIFDDFSESDMGNETDATVRIALADVDRDGDMDAIAANDGQTNKLYLHGGHFGYSAPGIAIGSETETSFGLVVYDIDRDGDQDAVFGNLGQANKAYFNNGAGGFSATGTAIGSETDDSWALINADLDNDGDAELVAGNHSQTNKLYLNEDHIGFEVSGTSLGNEADQVFEVVLADMDGDGDLDALTATNGQTNKLYANDGSGNFSATGTSIGNEVDSTYDLAVGDVDGDGDLDVIAANALQVSRLYLNDGNGGFPASGTAIGSTGRTTLSAVLGDVDLDGDLDLILGNFEQLNRLYLNDGSGGFGAGIVIGNEEDSTRDLILADVDDDGDPDLLVGNGDLNSLAELTTNKLYLNDGSGGFSAAGISVGTESDSTRALAVVDMDSDGDLDLVAGNAGQTNKLYFNDGSGNYSATGVDLSSEANTTESMALGDVNGDGTLDIIAGNAGQASRVYLNNGIGNFALAGSVANDILSVNGLALGDLDADGDMDMLVGNNFTLFGETSKRYLNNYLGSLHENNLSSFATAYDVGAVDTGDLNNDGTVDIVINDKFLSRIFLNQGDSSFLERVRSTSDAESHLFDFDNNGRLDIIEKFDFGKKLNLVRQSSYDAATSTFTWDVDEIETFPTRISAQDVLTGDVNGDGEQDLIARLFDGTVNDMGTSRRRAIVRLYMNSTSNTSHFDTPVDIYTSGDFDNGSAIDLGDVDNDGDLDILLSYSSTTVTSQLFLNDGSGSFSGPLNIGNPGSTNSVGFADIDSDGDQDILVLNRTFGSTPGSIQAYINNGSGGFPVGDILTTAFTGHSTDMDIGDIDGDGDMDLVIGRDTRFIPTLANALYLNDGGGNFAHALDFGSELPRSTNVKLADIDGNGTLDMVSANDLSSNSGLPAHDQTIYYFDNSAAYQTQVQQAVSINVNSGSDNISAAILSSDPVPSSVDATRIHYWLSNNGGNKWYLVQPDRTFTFPTVGNDLRWRAELNSLSPALSPAINTLTIDLDNDLDNLGDGVDPDDDNDQMEDVFENFYGLDPFDAADAALDMDGDGISNLDEYFAGTDPAIPNASGQEDTGLTRSALAKQLLIRKHGPGYLPPSAAGTVYTDVSAVDFNAAWIEQLSLEGITEGCAIGYYCPDQVVTKEQLAIMILKTKLGSAYVPPAATGTLLSDVAAEDFAADWIEDIYNMGISTGCDTGKFCPKEVVTPEALQNMLNNAFP